MCANEKNVLPKVLSEGGLNIEILEIVVFSSFQREATHLATALSSQQSNQTFTNRIKKISQIDIGDDSKPLLFAAVGSLPLTTEGRLSHLRCYRGRANIFLFTEVGSD